MAMLQSYKPELTNTKPISFMPYDMTGRVFNVSNVLSGVYRAEYDPIVNFGVVYINGTVQTTNPSVKFEMSDTFEFSILLKTQSTCSIKYSGMTLTFLNGSITLNSSISGLPAVNTTALFAANMVTGTWYHIMLIRDKIYLNGVLLGIHKVGFNATTSSDYITMSGNFSIYNFNVEPGLTYRPSTLLMVPSSMSKFLLNGQVNPKYFKRRYVSSYTELFTPNPDGFRDGLPGSVYTSSYWFGWVHKFSSMIVNPPNGVIQVCVGTTYNDGAVNQEVVRLGDPYTGSQQSVSVSRSADVVPIFIHLKTISGSVCIVDSNRLLWDDILS
jgi:hypothetical protein